MALIVQGVDLVALVRYVGRFGRVSPLTDPFAVHVALYSYLCVVLAKPLARRLCRPCVTVMRSKLLSTRESVDRIMMVGNY